MRIRECERCGLTAYAGSVFEVVTTHTLELLDKTGTLRTRRTDLCPDCSRRAVEMGMLGDSNPTPTVNLRPKHNPDAKDVNYLNHSDCYDVKDNVPRGMTLRWRLHTDSDRDTPIHIPVEDKGVVA